MKNQVISLILASALALTSAKALAVNIQQDKKNVYMDIQLQTPDLGKYRFTLTAKEKPSLPVLSTILNSSVNYFPTTVCHIYREVDNMAPSATYEAVPDKKVDVVFALGAIQDRDQVKDSIQGQFKNQIQSASNNLDSQVSVVDMYAGPKGISDIDWQLSPFTIQAEQLIAHMSSGESRAVPYSTIDDGTEHTNEIYYEKDIKKLLGGDNIDKDIIEHIRKNSDLNFSNYSIKIPDNLNIDGYSYDRRIDAPYSMQINDGHINYSDLNLYANGYSSIKNDARILNLYQCNMYNPWMIYGYNPYIYNIPFSKVQNIKMNFDLEYKGEANILLNLNKIRLRTIEFCQIPTYNHELHKSDWRKIDGNYIMSFTTYDSYSKYRITAYDTYQDFIAGCVLKIYIDKDGYLKYKIYNGLISYVEYNNNYAKRVYYDDRYIGQNVAEDLDGAYTYEDANRMTTNIKSTKIIDETISRSSYNKLPITNSSCTDGYRTYYRVLGVTDEDILNIKTSSDKLSALKNIVKNTERQVKTLHSAYTEFVDSGFAVAEGNIISTRLGYTELGELKNMTNIDLELNSDYLDIKAKYSNFGLTGDVNVQFQQNYGYDQNIVDLTAGSMNGYGFGSSNIHNVQIEDKSNIEYSKLSNIKWRDGADRVLVNVNDNDSFNSDTSMSNYLKNLQILNNLDAYVINTYTNSNKYGLEKMLNILHNRYTSSLPDTTAINSSLNEQGDNYDVRKSGALINSIIDGTFLTNSYNSIIQIIKWICQVGKKPENWLLIDDTVSWNTQYDDTERDLPLNYDPLIGLVLANSTYTDWQVSFSNWASNKAYKGEAIEAERWRFTHNADFFENNLGVDSESGQWIPEPKKKFSKTGLYRVNYQRKDNPLNNANLNDAFSNYRKWSNDYGSSN